MNASTILEELRSLGLDGYKRILLNHGVPEPCFGVKVEYLQKIRRRIKKDYQLALDLYDTGVYDAMYLAGLIADDGKMTRDDLSRWAAKAIGGSLAGTTVPGVATGNPHGHSLALEWIGSDTSHIAAAGWATLACIVSVKQDADLDIPLLKRLLKRVRREIHKSPDDVSYQMNGFVIACGCYVIPLTALAMETAEAIGPVVIDMGNTSCKVPFAPGYIRKVEQRGTLGKKRKSAKC